MSDRHAFIRAICESPDDDAPRLIYADWLEENGDHEEAAKHRHEVDCRRNCDRHGVWLAVKSTWVDQIRFDHDPGDYGTITVRFINTKREHKFENQHKNVWLDLINSSSTGLFVYHLSRGEQDTAIKFGTDTTVIFGDSEAGVPLGVIDANIAETVETRDDAAPSRRQTGPQRARGIEFSGRHRRPRH